MWRLVLTLLIAATPSVAALAAPTKNRSSEWLNVGRTGSTIDNGRLFIALPLKNNSNATATLRINLLRVPKYRLRKDLRQPDAVVTIRPGEWYDLNAIFTPTSGITRAKPAWIEVGGTVAIGRRRTNFRVSRAISVPSPGPGSRQLSTKWLVPRTARGGHYRAMAVAREPEEDNDRVATPLALDNRPSKRTTAPTEIRPLQMMRPETTGLPRGNLMGHFAIAAKTPVRALLHNAAATDLSFLRNSGFGMGSNNPNDPSVASGDGLSGDLQVVVGAGNTANNGGYLSLSTDGGMTFVTRLSGAILPPADSGICCDQVIVYSHKVNRFFWLMQTWSLNGENRLRLAVASPEDLIASNGTSWIYWDIKPTDLNLPNSVFDYPDLSIGDNYLYMSATNAAGNTWGLVVARIPLFGLATGTSVPIQYTDRSDGLPAVMSRLVQNGGDEIFWRGVIKGDKTKLRIFSCREFESQYFWLDIEISPYSTRGQDFVSLGPDGSNWLSGFNSGGPNGVRLHVGNKDEIIFQWSAAKNEQFPQPYIEVARIDRKNWTLIEQFQIWNDKYALSYASIDQANLQVGIALSYGGNGEFGTGAVGLLGDSVIYQACTSRAVKGRYGDYSTIRTSYPNTGLFSAAVYCVNEDGSHDARYVLFGPTANLNPPIVR